jgi:hypothetical protein
MKFQTNLIEGPISFSELTVRDYKELLKCILGDDPNKQTFVETVSEVFSNLTKKSEEGFKNLNALDFLIFLIDLRIYTGGNICGVTVKKNEKEAKLNLNLEMLKRDLIKTFSQFYLVIKHEALEIKFQCPSINRLLEKSKNEEEYLYFIKSVMISSGKQMFIKNNQEASELFDKLMPKLSLQIIEKYNEFAKACLNTNFLSRYKITESSLMFTPTVESLIWFSKLLFNEPLDVFYNNLFYLCYYGHMNLAHIEQGTVGEYTYYVNMLRSVQESKSEPPPSESFSVDSEEPSS